jgi:Uma2 family endonuclease
MAETQTLITAEQLLAMGNNRRFELVRGELVEMTPIGLEHFRVAGRLQARISTFVESRRLGIAGQELGCILSRNPDIVRAPDVAFLSSPRVTPGSEKFFEGAPDLAVEVLSPDDRAAEIQQKVREYLGAGAQLVWIVDPRSKTVTAYLPSGGAHLYAGNEPVPGDPVLPGFSFLPSELFKLG